MVLDKLTFAIAEPSITGLFGRNGSGKSTLGLLLAGLLHPTPGSITRAGQPVTSANAMVDIAYAGETTSVFEDQKLTETLSLRAHTHPNWDQAFAEELLDTFENPLKKRPDKLSRGQLSSFYATLGFASRAPVTIFDEVHLGMDAVVREIFYRILLADYTDHPRTFIISSHLIDEIENLLDGVIMIDASHIVETGEVDDVRARHARGTSLPSLTEILMAMTLTDSQRIALAPAQIQ
jgi:ABC-2 type transport system ATP-binding protein